MTNSHKLSALNFHWVLNFPRAAPPTREMPQAPAGSPSNSAAGRGSGARALAAVRSLHTHTHIHTCQTFLYSCVAHVSALGGKTLAPPVEIESGAEKLMPAMHIPRAPNGEQTQHGKPVAALRKPCQSSCRHRRLAVRRNVRRWPPCEVPASCAATILP